ncbi:hypothetical protein GH810_05690 [Acetobacterium paludosum]|uniref:Uncharacterized protein n=1 Tax=Acetobacterium paludosum TaxID=52693 RepID=A0A923HSF2_9FIRM|nr:hypothetical protein [Acetobacterium paludosum]MBC3887798.1 hypothetical protein [Acetobacterium paludosum]
MAKKSFNEKLNDSKDQPKIIEVTDVKAVARFGGPKMLIAPPLAYDAIMKKIPAGNGRAYRDPKGEALFCQGLCGQTGGAVSILITILKGYNQ